MALVPSGLWQVLIVHLRYLVMPRIAVLVLMALALAGQAALAQSNSRNSFPGRRIGGGTRGVCTARLVAHLTPANNIQRVPAAGPVRVAVLQGPTQEPYPLKISLEGQPSVELAASAAGVVVLSLPAVSSDTPWQSSYACPGGSSGSDDPLDFVAVAAPPALSLLRPSSDQDDPLPSPLAQCGGTVALAQVEQWLGVQSLPGEWPDQLPVRCEGNSNS